MIVDTHVHLVAGDQERYPFRPAGGQLSEAVERRVDAEGLLERMGETGVERAVLVQFATVHGYDNSYVVDSAHRYPDRFVAVGTIDGRAPDAANQLTYWVRERGAAGCRLTAAGPVTGVEWVQVPAVWERAAQLQVPVCVHFRVGMYGPGLAALRDLMERFPAVPVVLDHTANPPWEEGPPLYGMGPLLDLARYNLYVKFTTVNLNRLAQANVPVEPVLRRLVDGFGAGRVMWGSDLPNTPGRYADMVSRMRAAVAALPTAEQEWIQSGTALQLYPALRGA